MIDDVSAYDVALLGGGLSGLTLVRQLLDKLPDLRIVILEKRSYPVSEAAFKVGESTVEIGAHYLAEEVGLKKHLVDEQLPKFGLRFFFNNGEESLADSIEVGTSEFFPAPGYQVDRGRLENHLRDSVIQMGASFREDAHVRQVELGARGTAHAVAYTRNGQDHKLTANWIVDASGRAGLLKRKLDLAEPIDHNVNAVWFRVGAALRIDEWCDDPDWQTRAGKIPRRWLSTNHLLGRGYWVWIIPLASGATSIGIVTDPRIHALSEMNRMDLALQWLKEHEPLCAESLEPHHDEVQDFLVLKRLGYGCRQVFSADRWALTGEAAVFLDPLYSPGIDYIAMGNTMICSLMEAEQQGRPIDELAPRYDHTFLTLFKDNLLTYQDQYAVFGNPWVMSLKYVWDYALYWSFPALLYFNGKLTDSSFIHGLGKGIEEIRRMNRKMQASFREWNERDPGGHLEGTFVDQHDISILLQLNAELKERLEDRNLATRFTRNVEVLQELSAELTARVSTSRPGLAAVVSGAPPSQRRLENVFAALDF